METLNEKTFEKNIAVEGDNYIVLFYADWCVFCRGFIPIFETYETKVGGFKLVKANISDEGSELWDKFNVMAVPTIIAFRDGKAISRLDARLNAGINEKDFKDFISKL